MSAFDTTTNTVSTTFTNAYATVDLLPSASPQYAWGFERTTGWRYFEVYIDDAGGDNSTLLMGYNMTPFAINDAQVYGGDSNQAQLYSSTLAPHPYGAFPGSITAETGDVFMFAVDLTGQGRDHNGTPILGATISSGTGTTLHPAFGEVGKNGTWLGGGLVGWEWASGGFPMRARPVVVRDSTSASFARVSLRVVTTSFAYAIPAGMVAWADGPEGGGSLSATDTAVNWDPAKISSNVSLSGGNLYGTWVTGTGSTTSSTKFLYTTQLPSTGKRIIEVICDPSIAGKALRFLDVGLADYTIASITATANVSANKIGQGPVLSRTNRGVSFSYTAVGQARNSTEDFPGQILYVDFDTARYWQTGGEMFAGGIATEPWIGMQGAAICDPYLGNSGITFTDSVGLRFYSEIGAGNSLSGVVALLNVGQLPFSTFPQLPGWVSMDGGRRVLGIGAHWDTTTLAPSGSTTFYASNLIVRTAGNNLFQGTTSKNAGKYYFEIYRFQTQSGDWAGIRQADATTISATTTAAVLDQGLFFKAGSSKARYGTISSFTNSSSALGSGSLQEWHGIAVDFDAGFIWCGIWNRNDRAMNWTAGANPVTGTQPDFTFTASTTMRIAVIQKARVGDGGPICLVAEDSNVIGLPSGFNTWNGTTISSSVTMTPSGTSSSTGSGGGRVLWPYGVIT